MLESRESIREGEAAHLLLEGGERFARQQRPENVLIGFEAVAGSRIEIVQVTDHFRHHLHGPLGVKSSGRSGGHGLGRAWGKAARRRLTKSSKVDWNSCNTGANSGEAVFAAMALLQLGSGVLHSPRPEAAAYALDCMGQAFGDGQVVARQRLGDLLGYRALLLHKLPEKFKVEVPVTGQTAQTVFRVEALDRRKVVGPTHLFCRHPLST